MRINFRLIILLLILQNRISFVGSDKVNTRLGSNQLGKFLLSLFSLLHNIFQDDSRICQQVSKMNSSFKYTTWIYLWEMQTLQVVLYQIPARPAPKRARVTFSCPPVGLSNLMKSRYLKSDGGGFILKISVKNSKRK